MNPEAQDQGQGESKILEVLGVTSTLSLLHRETQEQVYTAVDN